MSSLYDGKKILEVLTGTHKAQTVNDMIREVLFDNRPPRALFDADGKALYDADGKRLYSI